MLCPNEETIAQYAEGKMNRDEQTEFLKHVSECPECSTLYAITFGNVSINTCPDEESIACLAEGKLSQHQRELLLRHMAVCETCSTEFYLLRKSQSANVTVERSQKESKNEYRLVTIVANFVLLIGSLCIAPTILSLFGLSIGPRLRGDLPWVRAFKVLAESLTEPLAFSIGLMIFICGLCAVATIAFIRKSDNAGSAEITEGSKSLEYKSECPDEESIACLAEGKLSQLQRETLLRHMAVCETCSIEFYLLRKSQLTKTTLRRFLSKAKNTYRKMSHRTSQLIKVAVLIALIIGYKDIQNYISKVYSRHDVSDILSLSQADKRGLHPEELSPTTNDNDFITLCIRHSPEKIIDAIKNGANVNARYRVGYEYRDYVGRTPLMLVAGRTFNTRNPNESLKVITSLIDAGADVNARDNSGMTALIHAARLSVHPEVITALLVFGARPKIEDKKGKIALDYAKENIRLKNTEALRRLEEASY